MNTEYELLVCADIELTNINNFVDFIKKNIRWFLIDGNIIIYYSTIEFEDYNQMIEDSKKGMYSKIINIDAERGNIKTNSAMLINTLKDLIEECYQKHLIVHVNLYALDILNKNDTPIWNENSLINKWHKNK